MRLRLLRIKCIMIGDKLWLNQLQRWSSGRQYSALHGERIYGISMGRRKLVMLVLLVFGLSVSPLLSIAYATKEEERSTTLSETQPYNPDQNTEQRYQEHGDILKDRIIRGISSNAGVAKIVVLPVIRHIVVVVVVQQAGDG